MVNRLKGWLQSAVLALFFLPFILPVTVVYLIWHWMLDLQFGIASTSSSRARRSASRSFAIRAGSCRRWRSSPSGGPTASRSCSSSPGCAPSRRRSTRPPRSTAPAAGAVQQHHLAADLAGDRAVLTIQLILQLKIFDQVYLFSIGGRAERDDGAGAVHLRAGLPQNKGGYGATVAVALFVIVIVFSVLQFQVLRARASDERRRRSPRAVADPRRRLEPRHRRAGPHRSSPSSARCSGPSRSTGRWSRTLKPEDEVVRPYIELWPDTLTFAALCPRLPNTKIGTWYLNSLVDRVGGHRARRRHGRCSAATPSRSSASPAAALLWWLILRASWCRSRR